MNEQPASNAAMTQDEERAALLEKQQQRAKAREDGKRKRDLDRLRLVDQFEDATGGAEGEEFAILDVVGEDFLVVQRGAALLFTQYMESKMTVADRFDFVLPHVKHPSPEKYKEIRARRPAVDYELEKLLGALYGMKLKGDEGK